MQSSSLWEGLRARLVHATRARGRKAALARELGVHRQTVSIWLSEEQGTPSAETTLRLLEWVKGFEAKQQKQSAGVSEAPAQKTRRKSKHEKDKPSDRKKK